MLTSRTHKFLHGKWQRERNKAFKDSSSFAATGEEYALDDLDITIEGKGVNNPDTYLADTTPVDSASTPKRNKVDIRNFPGFD